MPDETSCTACGVRHSEGGRGTDSLAGGVEETLVPVVIDSEAVCAAIHCQWHSLAVNLMWRLGCAASVCFPVSASASTGVPEHQLGEEHWYNW